MPSRNTNKGGVLLAMMMAGKGTSAAVEMAESKTKTALKISAGKSADGGSYAETKGSKSKNNDGTYKSATITVYKGERGFLPGKFNVSSDCDIIFTVVTRLEMRKLKNLVYNVDANAFVFASTIKEASGGIIKRKQRH